MFSHLLAAVLAAPDDDGPQLVFADWLEDYILRSDAVGRCRDCNSDSRST